MGNLKSTSASGDCEQERVRNGSTQKNMDHLKRFTRDIYLPQEVMANILSFVDPHTLVFSCRLVCKRWKEIVEGSDMWRTKLFRENREALKINNVMSRGQLVHPWYMYYAFCKHNAFGKNLLKNTCGEDKLQHWTLLENGGDKWRVEDIPQGSDPLPQELQKEGFHCCFATSYMWCVKVQTIDLYSLGLTKQIMELRPPIHVSEWFAARFDCGCIYDLKIALLNAAGKVEETGAVHTERRVEQWEGNEWHKVSHTFEKYSPDIRYIRFIHGGKDTQFWAGHYGSKMAGAKVYVTLPVLRKEETICEEDID